MDVPVEATLSAIRQRQRAAEARARARAEGLKALLPRAVEVLRGHGAVQVWLFGSLAVGGEVERSDVDLAVDVSSVEARKLFAKGYAALSKTFLRFASKIQLFLAEQLSNPRAGGLIEPPPRGRLAGR